MNGNLVIFMVTQERIGSPEAVGMYLACTTYHIHILRKSDVMINFNNKFKEMSL